MPRVGLTRQAVAAMGAAILDRDGASGLSLARVAAELGVRSPSLYNHVDGVDGLLRDVALLGIDQLAEACRTAVMGRSGPEAIRALASAYRDFATAHPGVYPLTQVARPEDEELAAASSRVVEPAVAVLASFGLTGDDLIHAARSLRSTLHGFVLLRSSNGFGLDVDPDESFLWMVELLIAGLLGATGGHEPRSAAGSRSVRQNHRRVIGSSATT